jgi:hypothetical protein
LKESEGKVSEIIKSAHPPHMEFNAGAPVKRGRDPVSKLSRICLWSTDEKVHSSNWGEFPHRIVMDGRLHDAGIVPLIEFWLRVLRRSK